MTLKGAIPDDNFDFRVEVWMGFLLEYLSFMDLLLFLRNISAFWEILLDEKFDTILYVCT